MTQTGCMPSLCHFLVEILNKTLNLSEFSDLQNEGTNKNAFSFSIKSKLKEIFFLKKIVSYTEVFFLLLEIYSSHINDKSGLVV